MSFQNDEYINDLLIDKYNLDSALIEQPSLYAKYSNLWVQAESDRLHAKETLQVIEAELDKKARAEITSAGGKITEAIVASYVTIHIEHKEANAAYIAANETANLLSCAMKAFEHRRGSLTDLVKLYTSNYFSEVPVTDGKTIISNIQEKKHAQLTHDINDPETKRRLKGR